MRFTTIGAIHVVRDASGVIAWSKRRLNVRIDHRTQTVSSIGGRDGSVRSADGLIDLQVAVPTKVGGLGGKTKLALGKVSALFAFTLAAPRSPTACA